MAGAYENLLGSGFPWEQRPFASAYLAEVHNRMVGISDEVYDMVAGQVAQGVNLGEGIPQLTQRVDDVLSTSDSALWPNRATVVARTESMGALNSSRFDAFKAVAEETGTAMEKVWLSTIDDRTRDTHDEADGQRVPVTDPFVVGGAAIDFPGDPAGPAEEVIQCVIGSTQVEWPWQLIYGTTRRLHSGPMVQLTTANGHELTVTPNHPVLTTTGYVPAGLLRPGQYVMATLNPPPPEVRDAPTSAQQVHGALCKAGESERVMGSRMDFHGDGTYDEIEVVGANGYLPEYRHPRALRQLQEFDLVGLDSRERPLSGLSGAVVARVPVRGDSYGRFADSLVGRPGEDTSFGGTEPSHPESVRVTSAADFQAQLRQTPDDGRTADTDFSAHLQYALAAGMAPCEIIEVNRLTGDHEVYNLSTSNHWFTGNGIALHNCRCTMLLMEPGEDTDMSNRQFAGE
jgi:hypothetical protein